MAYEIDQRNEADYRWFRFEAPTELLDELDHNLKIADGVLRFRDLQSRRRRAGDGPAGGRRAGSRRLARPRSRPAGAAAPARPVAAERGDGRAAPSREPAAAEPPTSARRDRRRARRRASPPSSRVFLRRLRASRGQSRAAALLDWIPDKRSRGVRAVAASNVNVVVITGNLTRDPELRSTGGGTSVCELRVAVNSRRKDGQTGEWVDKPNYFDVDRLGRAGRELRQLPLQGPPGGGRRAPRLARVGGQRRQRQTPGGADRRQLGPVPRLARRLRRWRRRQRRRLQPRAATCPPTPPTSPAPQPAAAAATTTSPSSRRRTSGPRALRLADL